MTGTRTWLALATLAAIWQLGPGAASAQPPCTDQNLLAGKEPVSARGVHRPGTLTDEKIPVAGSPYDNPHAALFVGEQPHVIFDLGAVHTMRAVFLQGDNNDVYRLSLSKDGDTFEPAFLAPVAEEPGMQGRIGKDFEWHARFIRLEPTEGDGHYSVSELAVYCKPPDPFPPDLQVVATIADDPMANKTKLDSSWKAALALACIPLLFAMGRMRPRARAAVAAALVIVGLLGWIRFGRFHDGMLIHPWDAFHYFVGSKYFDELGYTDLYNCLAEHEREAGRGDAIVSGQIRDLRTNVLHDGRWSLTEEGRCRAEFSPERRKEFEADLETFRPLFPEHMPFHRMLVDHGYNATPPHTAFLKLFTHFTPASRGSLLAIAAIDLLAYIGAFVLLWWGFGPRVAALGALFVGLSEPWSYLWTGGSVGRAVWLFFLTGGLALLARRRQALGGASLTVSGLMRFFPGVFVGGLGLWVIVRSLRERVLSKERRRTLIAIFGTLAAGVLLGGLVTGFDAYVAFFSEMLGHSSLAMGNHLGLENILSYVPGVHSDTVGDPRLSDPHQVLKELQSAARTERWPLWMLAVGASLALLVAYSWRPRARAWVATALTAPLLFSTVVLSNYDYVWMIVLVPLAITSRFRIAWLLGYVAATQILSLYVDHIELKHVLLSFLTGAMLLVFVLHYWRTTARDPDVEAEALEEERRQGRWKKASRDTASATTDPAGEPGPAS